MSARTRYRVSHWGPFLFSIFFQLVSQSRARVAQASAYLYTNNLFSYKHTGNIILTSKTHLKHTDTCTINILNVFFLFLFFVCSSLYYFYYYYSIFSFVSTYSHNKHLYRTQFAWWISWLVNWLRAIISHNRSSNAYIKYKYIQKISWYLQLILSFLSLSLLLNNSNNNNKLFFFTIFLVLKLYVLWYSLVIELSVLQLLRHVKQCKVKKKKLIN